MAASTTREVEVTVVRRGTRRVRVQAVATVLAGGALLAGCAGQPGAAALVDGQEISTARLAAATDELTPLFPEVSAQEVLGVLVLEPFVREVAQDNGVGPSDEEARALLEGVAAQQLGEEAAAGLELSETALAVGRYSLAASGLQEVADPEGAIADFQARVEEADIEINPRFGSFADLGVVAPTAPEWVVPAGGLADAAGDEGVTDGSSPAPTP
ncbi:hypothetical protein FBY24_0475 [Cellulomonas sp. SLBN-39]|nr:hypothetical protein FBY24_0475 [Cellulomonas sp. SLBN-39]